MPYVYVGKLSLLKTLSWLKNITLYPNSLLAAFGVFGLFIVTKKKIKKYRILRKYVVVKPSFMKKKSTFKTQVIKGMAFTRTWWSNYTCHLISTNN